MKKVIFVLLSSFMAMAMAAAPSGSYQNSCFQISWNGQDLAARCKNDAHDEPDVVATSITSSNFQALQNAQPADLNGNLVASGMMPSGGWVNSCFGSTYNASLHLLAAACKGPRGIPHASTIIATGANDVENLHGNLIIKN